MPGANFQALFTVQGATTALPLDLVSGATGAWGARKLRTAYAGNCLKVRRSSDNTTQDIGFSGGDLDSGALTSFVGAGDGFIDTWYDQSGNARNLTQATQANQPKVVASGSVITTVGGKSSPLFDASNDHFTSGLAMSSFIAASAYTALMAGRATSGVTNINEARNRMVFGDPSGYMIGLGFNATQLQPSHYPASYVSAAVGVTYPATAAFIHRYDGTNMAAYAGGGTGASVAAGNVGSVGGTMTVGFGFSGGNYFDGNICDFMLYSSALSTANLNALGANMSAYYGTTWTSI